ncbi:MAG: RNA polymerase sigma factor [bacterium]|nr:RNA polymerase sigma factor [bacterium]
MTSTSPQPSIDALLAHADWVRRLARSIAGETLAEDVAQDTWAAALRTPPGSQHNLRGWLTRLVQNFARQHRRSDRRRQQREAAVANAEPLPSSAELAERADLHRHVVRHVLALPEPGRTVVLLYFFEGLPLRDIANRQGLPLETVRTRLKRAVASLRRTLGARRQRALALLAAPAGTTMAGTVSSTLIPALLMSVKAKLLVAAIVVTALGFGVQLLNDDSAPTPMQTEAVANAAGDAASATTDPQRDSPANATTESNNERELVPTAPESDSATKSSTAAGPRTHLHGLLVGMVRDAPWSTQLVLGAGGADHPELRAAVNPNGTFTADVTPWIDGPGGIELIADDPGYLRLRRTLSAAIVRKSSEERPLKVQLTAACALRGRVLASTTGKPVHRAPVSVHLVRENQPVAQPTDSSHTDSDGRYEMRVPRGAAALVVALPPADLEVPNLGQIPMIGMLFRRAGQKGWLPASTRVVASPSRHTDVLDTTLHPGHAVTGTLREADGTPVRDAEINALVDDNPVTLYPPAADVRWWHGDILWFDIANTTTDEHGHFRLDNLPARECDIVAETFLPDAFCLGDNMTRRVTAPAQNVEIVLPTAVVTIRVEHDGKLVDGSWLELRGERTNLKGHTNGGRIRLMFEPGKNVRVTAGAPGFTENWIELSTAAGYSEQRIPLTPAPDRRVTLKLEGVQPATAHFVWHRLDLEPDTKRVEPRRFEQAGDDGVFEFTDLEPGRYRVEICRPRRPQERLTCEFANTSLIVDVPFAGQVERTLALQRGGRLRIRATTPTGEFLAGKCRVTDQAGRDVPLRFQIGGSGGYVTTRHGKIAARGVNEADRLLPPGRYDLTVELDDCDPHHAAVLIEAGEIATVEVVRTPAR